MQMNDDQLKRVQEWVKTKFTHGPCWVCGKEEWSVAPFVWELRSFHQGYVVAGGPIFPVITMFCASCGNLLLVSAVAAGIIKPPEPPSQQPKESTPQAAPTVDGQPAAAEG